MVFEVDRHGDDLSRRFVEVVLLGVSDLGEHLDRVRCRQSQVVLVDDEIFRLDLQLSLDVLYEVRGVGDVLRDELERLGELGCRLCGIVDVLVRQDAQLHEEEVSGLRDDVLHFGDSLVGEVDEVDVVFDLRELRVRDEEVYEGESEDEDNHDVSEDVQPQDGLGSLVVAEDVAELLARLEGGVEHRSGEEVVVVVDVLVVLAEAAVLFVLVVVLVFLLVVFVLQVSLDCAAVFEVHGADAFCVVDSLFFLLLGLVDLVVFVEEGQCAVVVGVFDVRWQVVAVGEQLVDETVGELAHDVVFVEVVPELEGAGPVLPRSEVLARHLGFELEDVSSERRAFVG